MPSTLTYPGVYVEEISSGVRTITGVGTSIALFIGRTKSGPLKKPTLCQNFSDFERTFSSDPILGDMPRAVRLFFQNGGTQCYVMRIASNADAAKVTLNSESNAPVLTLKAKSAGKIGETIRAAVTYRGPQPEATFNLELFRWDTGPGNVQIKADVENWINLSMDPASPRYAPTYLTQNSQLVDAELAGPNDPGQGFSQSGRPVVYDPGTDDTEAITNFTTAWKTLIGTAAPTKGFQISVDGEAYTDVDLSTLDVAGAIGDDLADVQGTLKADIKAVIKDATGRNVDVEFAPGPPPETGNTTKKSVLLKISSTAGDVHIRSSATADLAVPLMLGVDNGGLEVSGYAGLRPAPTGMTFRATGSDLITFAGQLQTALTKITIAGEEIGLDNSLVTAGPSAAAMFTDGILPTNNGNNGGVREKWGIIAKAINDYATVHQAFTWRAEVWGDRLAILPTAGGDGSVGTITTDLVGLSASFNTKERYYSLGNASDGSAPTLRDYQAAFDIIDTDVNLFNLMILPADAEASTPAGAALWGPAGIFCVRRRAMLLVDAPVSWRTMPVGDIPAQLAALRVGVVKSHTALFFPQLTVSENGLNINVGSTGAIAGLMARTDSNRGVWKAPAGTEADIRGIVGIARNLSDLENGTLNQRAINSARAFPLGIVNWGARTMDGDDDFGSEWKYIPVRRTALFIEESLYRGTQWVVFEPNDEPLWAQIRLNIGAFMHNLFRQGAFQGKTPKEAYLVKCDRETTTQNDINLGVVNIIVGFAPLKPAEFVVIKIQHLAGQIAS